MNNRLRVYFACALTNAPQDFKDRVKAFKLAFAERNPDCEVLEFFGLGRGVPDGLIVVHDLRLVLTAHIVVALPEFDSTGLGIEDGVALALGIPTLVLLPEGWKGTRMVSGQPDVWPDDVLLRRYRDESEIDGLFREAVRHYGIDPSAPPKELLEVAPYFQRFYRREVLGLPELTPQRAFRALDRSGRAEPVAADQ